MDYSTFNLTNFFIKKDSTLPELKFPLVQRLREKYDITDVWNNVWAVVKIDHNNNNDIEKVEDIDETLIYKN